MPLRLRKKQSGATATSSRGIVSSLGAPLSDHAAAFHQIARAILAGDGFHRPVAWLFRDQQLVSQNALNPEDNQDKVVQTRWLAAQAEKEAADAAVYTTESWWAPEVPADDPRFNLRAADRDDRGEALLTYFLRRDGEHRLWSRQPTHDADDGAVRLDEAIEQSTDARPLFDPLLRVWQRWDRDRRPG